MKTEKKRRGNGGETEQEHCKDKATGREVDVFIFMKGAVLCHVAVK